jgi:hypothetical protein
MVKLMNPGKEYEYCFLNFFAGFNIFKIKCQGKIMLDRKKWRPVGRISCYLV